MRRPDDAEVPTIKRGHRGHSSSFGSDDDRGVDRPERQISVASHELGNADPILRRDRFGDQVARSQITEEAHLGDRAEPGADEVRRLGDDERRDQQRTGVGGQQFETRTVVAIVGVDVGVQRANVDDQGDERTSSARISSMRSDTS